MSIASNTSNVYQFQKENILPASDPRSPFHVGLPSFESKPIDDLVDYFKYWKLFVKALIAYFKEIALVKEFEANLSYQLISSVQFPGCKDLPKVVLQEINNHQSPSPGGTPTKEVKRNLSSNSLNTTVSTTNSSDKRPGLFKSKSNTTFMKSQGVSHKKSASINGSTTKTSGVQYTNDIKVPVNFFPEASMFKGFPALMISQHHTSYLTCTKLHRDLTTKFIPRLETLHKQLSGKIKEIRASLKNESFANPQLAMEVSETGKILNKYMVSVCRYNEAKPVLKKKVFEDDEETGVLDDPFLLKLKLDYQLKNQLILEGYIFASYSNLQNIARDLLVHVFKELNWVVDKFGKLQLNQEFYQYLKTKISMSAQFEWDHFISMNPNFLNTYKATPVQPKHELRSYKSIVIPYANSIHNKCIRFGVLYKKSKILKSYNRHYYVLTCNYLHEFRFDNEEKENKDGKKNKEKVGGFIGHDDEPIKSYNLNDYMVQCKDEKSLKFQLVKSSNEQRKFTFRCLNETEYAYWLDDLRELLRFGCKHLSRFHDVATKIQLKEDETAKSKELKQREKFALAAASKSTGPGFNGVFTPRVKTPSGGILGNPFDQNFFNPIPSSGSGTNISSPLHSPNLSPRESVLNLAVANQLHQHQHDNYIKMQDEFFRQQQELLSYKMKELEETRRTEDSTSPLVGAVHSNSSTESMGSLLLTNGQPSAAAAFMEANRNLISNQMNKPVRFSISQDNDESEENSELPTRESSVPTVLISTDH
ncbi:predicted protein [Scheffersomyces stipitis CBS 6054]|uniref:PH domain-containing protein n=1 Tax=Scheffersomyces stipitis (strain ATCC 58785 / CBS 6054 / NBRC 10063 / NRRL Y-11545) TaxID=322104 RepID=A3LQP5_PICST|nr:predicted protein [Scheffersomyces stipitis CBS 6054]ABN65239.2 predicted protein [Scheffersomyces stipitis CBS 6054]